VFFQREIHKLFGMGSFRYMTRFPRTVVPPSVTDSIQVITREMKLQTVV
jgi:hypothetical protein